MEARTQPEASVCMCLYTHIHTHSHIYTHTFTHKHIHTCARTHIDIWKHTLSHIHTYSQILTHIHTCTCMHTHTLHTLSITHKHACTHKGIFFNGESEERGHFLGASISSNKTFKCPYGQIARKCNRGALIVKQCSP